MNRPVCDGFVIKITHFIGIKKCIITIINLLIVELYNSFRIRHIGGDCKTYFYILIIERQCFLFFFFGTHMY